MPLPRVLTVDPTGSISQIIRSAINLTERLVVQVDAPSGEEAIEEVKRGGYNLIVSAWEPDDDMKGWELAAHVRRESGETAIIILADENDPDMDEETQEEGQFLYLQRPLEPHQFIRVLNAALDSKDIFEAKKVTAGSTAVTTDDMGPVPDINLDSAHGLLNSLLTDLGAMAIILMNRAGEVLQEHGAVGYLDRDQLATALMPVGTSNYQVSEIVGGQSSGLQFYDGDEHDIFVLTAGLHYFVCIIFDGENGSRQLGMVNRYGRRAAEDIVALLGPSAWMLEKPKPAETRKAKPKRTEEPEEHIELVRAEGLTTPKEETGEMEAVAESTLPQLEAIADEQFDLDDLFGSDVASDDDLFSLDNMEAIAQEEDSQSGTLDWEQAQQLGILGDT